MKRKKFLISGSFMLALVAFAGSYHAYTSSSAVEEADLLLANVEALADTYEVSKEEKTREEECYSAGGNWNMASVCVANGFETIDCTASGEISIFGITLKGSYSKGEKYVIPWARYECKESKDNCCTEQGVFSEGKKLA
jgi:hypothetical protein